MALSNARRIFVGNRAVNEVVARNASSFVRFPEDGLLAFWKLADLTDSSGNGNNLVNTNNVQFVQGKIGNAAYFNGSNGLSIPAFIPQNYETFTVSAWVKRQSSDDFVWFIHNHSGFCFYWTSVQSGSDNLVVGDNSSWGFFSGPNRVPLDTWVHVCVAVENKVGRIYIDGQFVGSTNGLGDLRLIASGGTTNGAIEIGQQVGRYEGTKTIDAVGIWSRALTDNEVVALYYNGNGRELI